LKLIPSLPPEATLFYLFEQDMASSVTDRFFKNVLPGFLEFSALVQKFPPCSLVKRKTLPPSCDPGYRICIAHSTICVSTTFGHIVIHYDL
jgi:hypothetical protein